MAKNAAIWEVCNRSCIKYHFSEKKLIRWYPNGITPSNRNAKALLTKINIVTTCSHYIPLVQYAMNLSWRSVIIFSIKCWSNFSYMNIYVQGIVWKKLQNGHRKSIPYYYRTQPSASYPLHVLLGNSCLTEKKGGNRNELHILCKFD